MTADPQLRVVDDVASLVGERTVEGETVGLGHELDQS